MPYLFVCIINKCLRSDLLRTELRVRCAASMNVRWEQGQSKGYGQKRYGQCACSIAFECANQTWTAVSTKWTVRAHIHSIFYARIEKLQFFYPTWKCGPIEIIRTRNFNWIATKKMRKNMRRKFSIRIFSASRPVCIRSISFILFCFALFCWGGVWLCVRVCCVVVCLHFCCFNEMIREMLFI